MLGISRQTDYAARLILHLACQEGSGVVPIARIARERMLPVPYVRRVVGVLVAAGILATERGATGGVRLARKAAEITLLDVVRATEGGVSLNACLDPDHGCPFSATCPVRTAWTGINRGLEESLAAVRFDQLATKTSGHREAHQRRRETESRGGRRRAS